jgi:hypothetical protein
MIVYVLFYGTLNLNFDRKKVIVKHGIQGIGCKVFNFDSWIVRILSRAIKKWNFEGKKVWGSQMDGFDELSVKPF